MASAPSSPRPSVSRSYAFGTIALALAGLVVLAVTPLGHVVSTVGGLIALRVLTLAWLGLSLAADIRNWETYSRSRRHFAFGVWSFLAASAVATFAVG
ncbi:MAG: hypothetical protein AAGI52_08040 [Bacteroidota bacterium]